MSCALAGLIVLYTSALRERFNINESSKGLKYRSKADRNICTTPQCVTAAARLLQNMDPSVEPCQDFYQYACGGWIERHVIPETSSLHSVFNILRDELEIVLKGVLEMESKDDREAFKKAKTLYSSCMNESEYALLGSTYTLYYIVELHSMSYTYTCDLCRTLQNYLAWMLIMERVSSMSRRFKDMRAHYRKALHGTTVEEVRWRDCVRYVQGNMENAVGALYVRAVFSGNSKRMVRELIKKIQEAYVETLEELSWMDEQSKEKAREKVRFVFSCDKISISKTHFLVNYPGIMLNFISFYASIFLSVFPAGILQPPFFSEKQLQALNFGGIGMVIGHEITHGFDDQGRNFDKDGNMYNWWSNFSAEHFEDQSKCMVEQYGKFSWKLAGGQNVSGITTLGENIADNGGVRQAYKAYMKWVEREGEEPRLPGLEMDHKQLFFLNFAQVWCGACRPEYAIQSIKTDPHSPLEYRVLGSLQNFEAFSEAFHCARGTPMNPEEKCRVW
uniref:Membrane metallo-endopeptidase-like 1 n=1 Tax=Cyprinus carpio TaxID=7962 RepID=A0A8C1IU88_CYPCA